MKNLRVIITVLIISVITIFIGSAVRSYYLFLKEPVLPVYSALPNNSSIIISTKSVFKLFEAINNSALVDILKSNDHSYELINNYLDSINLKSNKLKKLLESTDVLFSIVPDTDRNEILIVTGVGKMSNNNLSKEIKKVLNSDSCKITKVNKFLFQLNCNEGKIWYYITQGIFAMSSDSLLISESFQCIKNNLNLNSDISLKKLISASGKRVDATLIINAQSLTNELWLENPTSLTGKTPFNKWVSFDLNIKKSSVILGGFTNSETDHLFKGQEPIDFNGYKYFPVNTALALTLSLSNVELYVSSILKKDTLHVNGFDKAINEKTKEIFNPKQNIKSWMGNSISLIYTSDYFKNNQSGQLIMIECRDKDSALYYLKPFIDPINDSTGRLYYASLPSDLFGKVFNLPEKLYCLISEKYVNISPDQNLLQYGAGKNYKSMRNVEYITENVGKSSNISLVIRPESVAKWLKRKNKNANKPILSFLSKQSSIGFQYSAGGNLEYTHAWVYPNVNSKPLYANSEYLGNNNESNKVSFNLEKEENEKNLVVEKPSLKDKAATTEDQRKIEKSLSEENSKTHKSKEVTIKNGINSTFIVNSTTSNQKWIGIFNNKGELLMYNHDGKKVWSFNAKESLLSGVHQVDVDKDGKYEYIANSRNYIYHIDSKGKLIGSHPIKLPQPVQSPIFVFDYDNKKDYRILYVGIDNKIYNVTMKGLELPDWQKPKVDGDGNITFHRTNGRDYIIYKNSNLLKIFDRRGRERIKVDKKLNVSTNSALFDNQTNSKGTFIVASQKGELIYITNNGAMNKTSFGEINSDPWFSYFDFDSDGSKDFIFIDKNKIIAYNRMKDVIGSKSINGGASLSAPFIYSSSSKDNWIFVRNLKTNEINTLHNSGRSLKLNAIRSETDPIVFNPGGSQQEILITTRKGKLILTPLEGL